MVTAITVVGAASPTVTEVSMETKYERLLRVDGATDEQLNAARVETNVLARQRLAEAIARIDRGEDVEAFAFGIAFRNDEQCDVSMGGDGRASVGLLDTLHWGIVKNTVQNGVLLPSLPARMNVVRDVADPFELIETVLIATAIIEQQRQNDAANEADAAIKQAANG